MTFDPFREKWDAIKRAAPLVKVEPIKDETVEEDDSDHQPRKVVNWDWNKNEPKR